MMFDLSLCGFSNFVSLLSKSGQLVQPIEGGGFVAFGQGRVIEYSIDKIIYCAFEREDRLPNMQQF
jgi:hypothetical protein